MTKKQIIRRFNLGAKTYEATMDIQLIAAQRLSAYINRSANSVLEIGCGTGSFSQYLVKRFEDEPILLSDISTEMVKITQNRFSTFSNVKTICQDGETLSSNSAYDLIASNMALHWFDDVLNGIQNILQLMASGGCFAFNLLGKNSLKEWDAACNARNYSAATLDFISFEEIRDFFPAIQFTVEKYLINYTNAHTFLRTLRNIGGTASYAKSQLTAHQLRSLLREHNDTFPVTYEVIYGCYIKP